MTNALSLNPETFEQGGNFDGPLTLISAKFVDDYDFNGKAKPSSGLLLDFAGESGKPFNKFYGIGKSTKFAVINDGKALQPVGATKGLNQGCKTAILISELVSCGIDADSFNAGDITFLNGLHAEWTNKALQEFVGKEVKTNSGDDAQILVPTELYLLPDEDDSDDHTRFKAAKGKAAAGKKTAAKGKAAAKKGAAKGPSEDELADEAAGIVVEVLAGNDGEIAKAKLTSAVIKAIGSDNKNKAALVKLAMSNDYLGSREEFGLEDGVVSIA